jgi:hypothetical protein
LFSATDPGGYPITEYYFYDKTSGNGYWALNGVAEPSNQVFGVTAAQLSEVTFHSGTTGSDNLLVCANDPYSQSPWAAFSVNAPAQSSIAASVSSGHASRSNLAVDPPVKSNLAAATPQPVSVTIGGPGNDSLIFHAGAGTVAGVNTHGGDISELEGSSPLANSKLAELLQDALSGHTHSAFQWANSGHDTIVGLGNHDSMTLTDVRIADLHASNFIIH